MTRIETKLIPIAIALLACSGAPERAPVDGSSATATPPTTATPPAPATPPATATPPAPAPTAQPKSSFAPALEADLARIDAESGGTLGVAVLHIETGDIAALRGDERFPMQSVFKFLVGAQILKLEAEGKLRLDQKVTVRREDLRWAHSPIAERSPNGTELTVLELLRAMVSESDNTAADVLLPLAGGPAAVTQWIASHGFDAISVNRPEGELILDFHGIPDAPGRAERTTTGKLVKAVKPAARAEAIKRYLADPRDTAKPIQMARLLAMLQQGKLLPAKQTALLLQLMTDTTTGANRFRAGLPEGMPLAHKTGTSATYDGMTAVINDVGIITLPNGRGHLVIAAFVKEANKGSAPAEAAIAAVARAALALASR